MKDVLFKSEIPIATNNERIFDATFVIEQWFRRILLTAIKFHYGSAWMSFFDNKDVKAFNKELRKIENRPMVEYDGSNIIWFTSITELAEYIVKDEIKNIIEDLTAVDPQILSSKLKLIKEVRNTMAHHRTITDDMHNEFETECEIFDRAIGNFKSNFLYKTQSIKSWPSESKYSLINYFNDKAYLQNDIQAFITEGEYYIEIVHLPGMGPIPQFVIDYQNEYQKRLTKYIDEENYEAALRLSKQGCEFIDIKFMVETFKGFVEDIIGIFVNKSMAEFYIVLPKKDIEVCIDKYRGIVDRFFAVSNNDICSIKPYEQQNAKYICNPMIWFYENRNPNDKE